MRVLGAAGVAADAGGAASRVIAGAPSQVVVADRVEAVERDGGAVQRDDLVRDAAGDASEFYTPRPVVRFIVEAVNPQLGEWSCPVSVDSKRLRDQPFDSPHKMDDAPPDRIELPQPP